MIGSFKDFITERSTNERVVVSNKEASDLAKSKSGKKKDAVVPGSSQSLKNHDRQQKADEERAKTVEDVDTDDDEE